MKTKDIDFTFGITTDGAAPARIEEILQSIRSLKIPRYEVLIIGANGLPADDVRYVPFDETQKTMWITRKKNLLAQEATYENVVIFHDYYVFDKEWYTQYVAFGNEWDVCSNAQLLLNKKRHFTDWVTWDSPRLPRYTPMRYDDWSHTDYMYQSGGYMLVKKDFMKECPMDETMGWGNAEDVEWSLRMRKIARWKCNRHSIVRHNKVHRDCDYDDLNDFIYDTR